MQNLRIVFAGTPEAAVPSLERLAASAHEIVAVVTRPPAPLGRKRVLTPSPVAQAAERLGLPVIAASHLDDEATSRIAGLDPDLGVIVAYGALVREPLLSIPPHGWINLHFSLLPAWRGAAPVQHAVIAGEKLTGAAVFQLVPALDAGDVFAEIEHPVGRQTAGELLGELASAGGALLASVVDAIAAGTARATPQVGRASLAPKLTLADGRIDWGESTSAIDARLRGVTPEPGAHTEIDEARFKIHDARPVDVATLAAAGALAPGALKLVDKRVLIGTGDGALELIRVQPAGRTAMASADWWRGLGRDEVTAQ